MKNNYLFLIFLFSLTGTFAQAQVQFCGEPLPLDQPDVKQYWERSQSQQATLNRNLARLKQRIAMVSPVIDPIMERYAIPKEFKYLPIVEGIRHPYSRSATERGGFWQLNPQTARRLGLMVAGRHRDQRYDLSRSTVAACRYLAQLHTEFGSWALVAAAYSLGPAAVRQVRAQSPTMSVFSAAYHPESRSYLYPAIVLKELVAGSIPSTGRLDTPSSQAPPMRSPYPAITRRKGTANSLTDKPESLSTLNEATSFRRVRTLTEDVQTAPAAPVKPAAATIVTAPVATMVAAAGGDPQTDSGSRCGRAQPVDPKSQYWQRSADGRPTDHV